MKFSSDFHRDKKASKGDEFHAKRKEDIEEASGLKNSHFKPIKDRLFKIDKKMREVQNFQAEGIEYELMYQDN